MSDEAVSAKTGRAWAAWVEVLDEARAYELSHRDIARHLRETFPELDGWWAQTITVGYERIHGLREVGQVRDGAFEANKSRTLEVPLPELYRMFAEARRRNRWLDGGWSRVRTSTRDRSIRVDWDDGTQVNLYFTAKGDEKSVVAVQHTKLPTKKAAEAAKLAWHARLDTLRDALK